MKPIRTDESGQVMPLALIGLFAILGITFFSMNVGRLLIQRERTRMLTDVTVMSGATVYARCLNFDAALKKINDVTKFLDDALGWFPLGGEALVAADDAVKEAREGFEAAAPWLTAACLEFTAISNHVPALPLWNVKDLYEMEGLAQGLIPSLHFDKSENNASASYSYGTPGESYEHYSYRHHASGETVDVEKSRVKDDAAGGAQGRSRDQKTGRFVKHDKGKSAKAEGEHSLTLITYDTFDDDSFAGGVLKTLPHFYSVARARVSGGNFDFSSSSSMEWGCFLAPVTAKDESVTLDIPEFAGGNAIIRELKHWAARVPAILH